MHIYNRQTEIVSICPYEGLLIVIDREEDLMQILVLCHSLLCAIQFQHLACDIDDDDKRKFTYLRVHEMCHNDRG